MSNADVARRLSERIAEQVRRAAGKGCAAAGIFLAARIRETLNVPAVPGQRAIPGAPMRKVTGNAQRNVRSKTLPNALGIVVSVDARSARNFNYPRYHEKKQVGMPGSGKHPFMAPTVRKYRTQLRSIIGSAFTVEFR